MDTEKIERILIHKHVLLEDKRKILTMKEDDLFGISEILTSLRDFKEYLAVIEEDLVDLDRNLKDINDSLIELGFDKVQIKLGEEDNGAIET